jgi:hypothetical protein
MSNGRHNRCTNPRDIPQSPLLFFPLSLPLSLFVHRRLGFRGFRLSFLSLFVCLYGSWSGTLESFGFVFGLCWDSGIALYVPLVFRLMVARHRGNGGNFYGENHVDVSVNGTTVTTTCTASMTDHGRGDRMRVGAQVSVGSELDLSVDVDYDSGDDSSEDYFGEEITVTTRVLITHVLDAQRTFSTTSSIAVHALPTISKRFVRPRLLPNRNCFFVHFETDFFINRKPNS